jgi:hypothetical protein
VTEHVVFDDAGVDQLVSFGTDNGGDVYVVGLAAGEIYRIDDPTPSGDDPAPDPTAPPTSDPGATTGTTAPGTTAPPATDPPATSVPATSTPPGTIGGDPGGLLAEYFEGVELAGEPHARIEPRVYLDVEHEPFEGFPADGWSARWSGELRVDTAGEHTLIVTSDDGARLWVDGEVVIDAWAAHSVRDDAVEITLEAGRHPVRLEYFDQDGVAFAKLSWIGPGLSREVIPGPNLYPAPAPAGG